ncbi:MAG TPA: ATP-binding protein [Noviherbaspirillum sp.]
MAGMEAIRHSGAPVENIWLAPLSLAQLNRLVADTLHVPAAVCEPLARLVFERTEGNPFFFIQFLVSLHKEGLLQWSAQDRVWQWNLDRIKTLDFADNVVELMVGKLRRLPAPTQQALQVAACQGNKFDLRNLALVNHASKDEARQSLSAAIEEDLIVCVHSTCKFLHDRIQQAAYSLIPEERRSEVHLRIGRAFMTGMTTDELAEHVFDVANQFNLGAALLAGREEKTQVAKLNLQAGRKAKASAAYASACSYLAAGMALLEEGNWKEDYRLMFDLGLERANCEYLTSNFDTARQLIATLMEKGTSRTDLAATYHLKVLIHEMESEHQQAVDSALDCLRLFGMDILAHPGEEAVRHECETVWCHLEDRSIESLIDLPRMADPEMQSAMDILQTVHTAAFLTDVNLSNLLPCRILNLSLKHGITGAFAHGCAWFGACLGPVFHRYQEGYRFATLACDVVEKHGFFAYKAKACFAREMAALWTQPVSAALDFVRAAYRSAVETGDLSMACYSWLHILTDMRLRGDALDIVWRESEQGLDFVRKSRFRLVADGILVQQRFIANMRGQTASFSSFSDTGFDEAAFEAQLNLDRESTLVCFYWILKLMARFLSGDYEAAFASAQKAQALLGAASSRIQLLDYFYYTALSVAALHEKANPEQQREWRELLAAHQEQLREWAKNCPSTFHDKFALVSAEIARLQEEDLAAMRLYEQAIHAARENGFLHSEGIAHELAAKFYFARGFPTSGKAHLEQARNCYAHWGAEGKVRQLDETYPEPRMQDLRIPSALAKGETQLDLQSVTKASQAISGRIVQDELIDTLMHIMIENAGAQNCCLLLVHDEELLLAADARVERQTVHVRLHDEQTLPQTQLPIAILNYVRRSREQVLLMDAAEPHPFSADPYFAQRSSKSVLCLPILRQSELIGLLYLENNLATHAFTQDRVKVLEVLACQAAISLENARLFTDLQKENIERKRTESALREREARIRQLVESNIIGIFFFDLRGGIGDANNALLHMLGYDRDDLLSGKLQWASLTPPAYRAQDERKEAEVRRTGKCTPYEKEFLRKDGSHVPVLIGAALFEGSREQGVAFVLDLSERKKAETEREARRAAEAANRAKSAFLANMSHELRTPLNGILGYAQILERDPALGERQLAGVDVVRKSGEHLLALINDILDLAKIEAGKMELCFADLQLAKFVQTITEIVGVKAAQKGLELVCDMAPDVPQWIRADEKRLRQVLLNLLANAVKFTDRGRIVLRVSFLPPARLCFEVQDTGIGIAADQLDRIFQPFEQAGDTQRRLAGTGLGLAISREYVRLMGGDIRVESRIGHGSLFRFELEAQPARAATAAAAGVVTGYTGPRKKILVIDDVAENRRVMFDLLSPLGFEVIEAYNGRQGLDTAQSLRPDLILMDIVMPEMDGLEATRCLRRMKDLKDVPIIAMSASVSATNSQQSLDAGMNAFLPKPVNVDSLLNQIAALLRLDWIHSLPDAESASESGAAGPVVTPPMEEMEVLHRLAQLGNMQDIMAHANQLAERDKRYRPFASRLMLLAKGYQSQAVLRLVEQYLNSGSMQDQKAV